MNVQYIISFIPKVLAAVPMTLYMTAVSMVIGSLLGLLFALARVYKIPVFNQFVKVYVSVIRGIPLVVQLYVAYYWLPGAIASVSNSFGLSVQAKDISAVAIAITAFSLDNAAYLSETFRSALESVESGQMEAAYSVGMTPFQGLSRIIIPQAFVVAIPNFGNLFIGMIKESSLAFMVSVSEIMSVTNIEASAGLDFVESFLVASILYWIICSIFEQIFKYSENKLKKFKTEVTI
jgi:L-cystine transport system permease protein